MDLLPPDTAQFCGIHKFDFRIPRSETQNEDYEPGPMELDEITNTLFGVPFAQFQRKTESGSKHGYRDVYTFKDNRINIYTSAAWRNMRGTALIEINGSYFDRDLEHNVGKVFALASKAHTLYRADLREWHPFIDDRMLITGICKVRNAFENKNYIADRRKITHVTTGKDAPETFYVGNIGSKKDKTTTADRVLAIYESGKFRAIPSKPYLPYLRYEMRLTGQIAKESFIDWLSGKPLYELCMGLISGTIHFHQRYMGTTPTRDRVTITTWWKKFTAGASPIKYTIQARSDPDQLSALDSLRRAIRRTVKTVDDDHVFIRTALIELSQVTGVALSDIADIATETAV